MWVFATWESTVPNYITLARVLALLPLALVLGLGYQLAGVTIFALAAASDMLDGWLSRLLGQESAWGKLADPLADKIFVYGASILLLPWLWPYGLIPVLAIALRDWDVERLRADYPYRAPKVPTLFSAKVKTWFFMVGLGCVMAMGSPLDQLPAPASALNLAYASLAVALGSALYSWWWYHELFRTKVGERF